MSSINGNYGCLWAIVGGKPLDAEVVRELLLTLDDGLYRTARGSQTLFEGQFAIDQSDSPWRIDITAVDGPLAGRSAEGIVQVKDDTLTICHTMPGEPRPTEFVSTEANGAQLVAWRTTGIVQ